MVSAHSPQRTCAGCGEVFDSSRLVRLALSPDKTVVLDYLHRLPGRGAWVFPCRECFERAAAGKGLSRAFKEGGVRMDAGSLFAVLTDTNRRRFLETIHLARKAGALIAGGNNLEAVLKHEPVHLVLITDDASDNTVDRFTSKAAARNIPVIRALSKSDLGESLGRDIQAVLGVTLEAFAVKLIREATIYDAVMNRTACKKMR